VSIYLGLDASTQSLTAILIDVTAHAPRVVFEHTFTYDAELPHYGTTHGVLRGADPAEVVSPPLMWAEALDHMMATLVERRPAEMARLAAVSGSAQQHGSVYLNAGAASTIASLDARAPLAGQLAGAFSRPLSPVWMDSSTTAECREITAAVGGDAIMAQRTGSRAFERFAGPQIRKFFKHEPDAYGRTARIHLISSFLAALLSGADAAVDAGDGSGMSLLDLTARAWWPAALAATAPRLAEKLPPVAASSAVVGSLGRYWRERYGLPAARVIAWSGDNTCSMIGTGTVAEGQLTISLGTSDTIFGLMREPRVSASGIGHVFGAPTGDFMGITVFKNGSLARERIRDTFGLNWAGFSAALRSTPPGNGGALMLPWFDPEITPHVEHPGVRHLNLSDADGPRNVRAVVEGQMMAMANHSRWMGVDISTIHATGGAAGNRDVLQVMADVFNADVYQFAVRNSACLGAALRAWHADQLASGDPLPWTHIVKGIAEPRPETRVRSTPASVAIYAALRQRYADFERSALGS
jgi:xylulokinase